MRDMGQQSAFEGVERPLLELFPREQERKRTRGNRLTGPILEAADDDDASFHLHGQAVVLTKEAGASAVVNFLVEQTRAASAALSAD